MHFKSTSHTSVEITFDTGDTAHVDFTKLYRNIDRDFSGVQKPPITSLVSQVDHNCFHYKSKPYAVTFTEKYQITPKNLLKTLRGFVYNTKIKPVEKWVNILARGYNKGAFKWGVVEDINRRVSMIETMTTDGLEHLIPLVLVVPVEESEPTKYLKNLLGKSNWRQFCKNSMTRNALIVKKYQHRITNGLHIPSSFLKYSIDPSGVLPSTYEVNPSVYKDILNSNKVSTKEGRESISRDCRMYHDTINMYSKAHGVTRQEALQVHAKVKTFNRIKELHEHYTLLINLKMDASYNTPFEWMKDMQQTGKISGHDYVIHDTIADIKQEGVQMKHCVGSYGDSVKGGRYMVVSFRQDGDRLSTLGLRFNTEKNKWEIHQHYGRCNQLVNDDLKKTAKLFEDMIND